MKAGLTTKIILPTSAVISSLVIAILLFLNIAIQDAMTSKINQEIEQSQIVLNHFLKDRADALFLNARIVAEAPQFKSVLGTPDVDHGTIWDILQEMQTIVESDKIVITNGKGTVLARSDNPEESGEDLSKREDVRRALQGREFSSLVAEDGGLYQSVTLPVVSQDMIDGTLSVRYKIDHEIAERIHRMTGSHVGFFAGKSLLAYSGGGSQKETFERLLQNYGAAMDRMPTDIQASAPQRFQLGGEDHIGILSPIEMRTGNGPVFTVISKSLTKSLAFLRKIRKILIVAGIAAMFIAVLAGFILARGIARPIMRLAQLAQEIARGNLGRRAEVDSNDEVGKLGESFNLMAADLSKAHDALMEARAADALQVQELEKAKSKLDEYSRMLEDKVEERTRELGAANEKLHKWVKELEQQRSEIAMLNEMGDLLQSCMDLKEAFVCISRMSQKFFPQWNGALSLAGNSQKTVETVCSWGSHPMVQSIFPATACMALRNGRMYQVGDTASGLVCSHLGDLVPPAYVCGPLMAHGETLGVIHYNFAQKGAMNDRMQKLVGTVAKNMALALANVKLRSDLRDKSIRDPLTGLYNRRYMEETLEMELARASRDQGVLGLIMIDLDHFKHLNDKFGHEAGDLVMQQVGEILKTTIRRGDIPCRYGGEEFLLIFPDVQESVLVERAEQLRSLIKKMEPRFNQQLIAPISASIGLALYPANGETAAALIHAADSALYQAKHQGRDRVIFAKAG